MIPEYKRSFIDFMIESNVLTFGDFTTKSGRKTPFFINTGLYNTGKQMYKLGQFYADTIAYNCSITEKVVLFGPAYKGIPLVTATAISLRELHPSICFNRKEIKDHGEGGSLIGYKPQDGDKIIIVEDVVTAGTSVRESVTLLKAVANVEIKSLIVSVDRQEKGQSDKSALTEIYEEFGIETVSIVNLNEIMDHLWDKKIDDKTFLNDDLKKRIIEYRSTYGVK